MAVVRWMMEGNQSKKGESRVFYIHVFWLRAADICRYVTCGLHLEVKYAVFLFKPEVLSVFTIIFHLTENKQLYRRIFV